MRVELTVAEYARTVVQSERTIFRWIHDLGMPHSKIGGRVMINPADVARWWEARKNRTNREASRAIAEKYRKFPKSDAVESVATRRRAA